MTVTPSTLQQCRGTQTWNPNRWISRGGGGTPDETGGGTQHNIESDYAAFMMAFSDVFMEDRYYQNFNMVQDMYLSEVIGFGTQFYARRLHLPPHTSVRTSHDSASRLTEGQEVVLKWMTLYDRENLTLNRRHMEDIITELRVLSHPSLRLHPRILDVYGFAWDKVTHPPGVDVEGNIEVLPVIMVEYGNWGTLNEFLQRTEALELHTKLLLASDIAHGLNALHRMRIVHSDVKPDNILVCGLAGERPVAKLSDFGTALILDERPSPLFWETGTDPWMAPEYRSVLSHEQLLQTDAYSCGLVLWTILLNGTLPWTLAKDFQAMKAESDRLVEKAISSVRDAGVVPPDRIGEITKLFKALLGPPESRSLQGLLAYQDDVHVSENGHSHVLPSWEGPVNHRPIFHDMSELKDLPLEVQRQFMKSLQIIGSTLGYSRELRAEAYYAAAIMSLLTVGTVVRSQSQPFTYSGYDIDAAEVARLLREAAKLGSPSAQAHYSSIRIALEAASASQEPLVRNVVNCPGTDVVSFDTITQWLRHATFLGSHIASKTLRDRCSDTWRAVDREFRTVFCGVGHNVFGVDLSFFLEGKQQSVTGRLTAESSVGEHGDTALHVAATVGNLDLTRALSQGASIQNINKQNKRGETPLLQAARSGHYQVAEYLLSVGADAGILTNSGENPLHWLCAFSEAEEALFRLAASMATRGAAVDQVCSRNMLFNAHFRMSLGCGTPLCRAVQRVAYSAAGVLLRLGADPWASRGEEMDSEGEELPHAAAVATSSHLYKFLRLFVDSDSGQGVRPPPWYGKAGLFDPEHVFEVWRAYWNRAPTFQSAAPNAFVSMAERGREKSLLAYAVAPDLLHNRMALHGPTYQDAMQGTIDFVAGLPTQEFDRVTSDYQSALMQSVLSRDVSLVAHLLSAYPGATTPALTNPVPSGIAMKLPVQLALSRGERYIFDLLLHYAAPNSTVGLTSMRGLTDTWFAKAILWLTTPKQTIASAPVNRAFKNTIQLAATAHPDPHYIHSLLQGTPPAVAERLVNEHGPGAVGDALPLSMAVLNGYLDVGQVLLQYGARIDEEASNVSGKRGMGRTPLGVIISFNSTDATEYVRWLLDHGASWIVNRASGLTALHLAIQSGKAYYESSESHSSLLPTRLYGHNARVLALLLERMDADQINKPADFGLTALHLAVLRLWPEAVRRLLVAGADPEARLEILEWGPCSARELAQHLDEEALPVEVKQRGPGQVQEFLRRIQRIRDIFDEFST